MTKENSQLPTSSFEASIIDFEKRPDLYNPHSLAFQIGGSVERHLAKSVESTLAETLIVRRNEIKETRGKIDLLKLVSLPPASRNMIFTPNLLWNKSLTRRGILAPSIGYLGAGILEELEIFEKSKIKKGPIPAIAQNIRETIFNREETDDTRLMWGFDPKISLRDLIMVHLGKETHDEVEGHTYAFYVSNIELSPEQKAKFNEVLKVGIERSTIYDWGRLLIGKELK